MAYAGEVSAQELKIASSAEIDFRPYLDDVRAAIEQNGNGKVHKWVLPPEWAKERRQHSRRYKTAAEMLDFTLKWAVIGRKNLPENELWGRLYKHGEEPEKRNYKKSR